MVSNVSPTNINPIKPKHTLQNTLMQTNANPNNQITTKTTTTSTNDVPSSANANDNGLLELIDEMNDGLGDDVSGDPFMVMPQHKLLK